VPALGCGQRTYDIFCSNFFIRTKFSARWVTYLQHILFNLFFCYKQICPSYHHYMGKKLSISRCNRHFSLLQLLGARSSLMPAASTTHFAAIMSICFQQACTHMHMRLHAYAHSHSSMHACL